MKKQVPLPPTLPLRMDALEARLAAVLRECALPRERMYNRVKPEEVEG